MPRPRTNKTGKIFGRLTIVSQQHIDSRSSKLDTYICQCECGNTVVARYERLIRGSRKSCGCLNAENLATQKAIGAANRAKKEAVCAEKISRPKKSAHPLWGTYKRMIGRCYNPLADAYKYYGARGVVVCDRWKRDFWAFVADVGERPEAMTLDRRDNAEGYSPDNCRWATKEEQYTNTTTPGLLVTIGGVTKFLTDWARERNFNVDSARRDIKGGMPPDVAVIAAVLRKQKVARGERRPEDWEACYVEARRRLGH